MSSQTRHSIAAILALVVGLWAAPAYADLFTVDWDVVPHEERELFYDDSPFYDCNGSHYANRLCSSLWDTGLALDKPVMPPIARDLIAAGNFSMARLAFGSTAARSPS